MKYDEHNCTTFLINSLSRPQANEWCSRGIDLLASQQLEKCTAPEYAAQALGDIEEFLAAAAELGATADAGRDFRHLFDDLLTLETRPLCLQVVQRLHDVKVMCERRVAGLKPIVIRSKMVRPVQPVPPEPAVSFPIEVFSCCCC